MTVHCGHMKYCCLSLLCLFCVYIRYIYIYHDISYYESTESLLDGTYVTYFILFNCMVYFWIDFCTNAVTFCGENNKLRTVRRMTNKQRSYSFFEGKWFDGLLPRNV